MLAIAAALLCVAHDATAQSGSDRWVATWATAEVGRPQAPVPPAGPAARPFMANSRCPAPPPPPVPQAPGQAFAPPPYIQFTNQTLRQIVHTSIGGSRARVVLSNAYGTAPVTVGAAHVALRDKQGAIQAASSRPLTFSGKPTMTIPINAVLYSDPVSLTVPPMADLAVDLYLPGTTNVPGTITMHGGALQTSYISETGNYAGKATMPEVGTTQSWYLLSRVDLVAPDASGAIVAFGDSITDGARSTPDTNNRWPDHLARRLQAQGIRMGVLNAGIGGNRVLNEASVPPGADVRAVGAGINALGRFEHHVLALPGITHVIVLEGINDIGNARDNPTPTAEDLIAAHKQLIEQAHARGLKAIGATLTPFWGAAYYSDIGEAKRQALNEWIRSGKAYDGVVDFDKATRDPADPKKLLEKYDSCDYLHPSDAGYKAMGDAIDLSLFKSSAPTTASR
ncbi:MAG TPA: SGNH/GDSL hydrolase family protein [Vicinamibacterales bacterium]|nr:SGNH/GDSL hydrolase family protein [Vicinamibacterales bacterium]